MSTNENTLFLEEANALFEQEMEARNWDACEKIMADVRDEASRASCGGVGDHDRDRRWTRLDAELVRVPAGADPSGCAVHRCGAEHGPALEGPARAVCVLPTGRGGRLSLMVLGVSGLLQAGGGQGT